MTGKQAFPHRIHCNPHLSIERTAGVFDASGKKEIRNMFSVINGFYSVSPPSPPIAAVLTVRQAAPKADLSRGNAADIEADVLSQNVTDKGGLK